MKRNIMMFAVAAMFAVSGQVGALEVNCHKEATCVNGGTTTTTTNNTTNQGGNGFGVGIGIAKGGNASATGGEVKNSGNSNNSNLNVNVAEGGQGGKGGQGGNATIESGAVDVDNKNTNSNTNLQGQQQGQMQSSESNSSSNQEQSNENNSSGNNTTITTTNIEAKRPVSSAAPAFATVCSNGISYQGSNAGVSLANTSDVCTYLMVADAYNALGDRQKVEAYVGKAASAADRKGFFGILRSVVTLGILN